jgi:hypothetical protein
VLHDTGSARPFNPTLANRALRLPSMRPECEKESFVDVPSLTHDMRLDTLHVLAISLYSRRDEWSISPTIGVKVPCQKS